ncbi:hypothetical protein PV326_013495, partial [Microctonus aethiopoides]
HYEVLNVKIKNGDEIIKLKWKRTGEYLVNKNVPIWLAKKHTQPVLAPRIMDGMGEIITYHDVEKSSAVIYMSKFKVFYGNIDTRFYIIRLPFDELFGPNIYYEVGNGYIFSYDKKKKENNDVNRDIRAALFEDDSKNAEDDLKKNDENHENENEIVDANELVHYDDIITELNQDDINTMNSILNSANEEDDEIAHGDNYQDKSQIQENYDDILAKLTEDEENANNPVTNVNQDDIVKNTHDNDILAEVTPDELNLINSIIDSAALFEDDSKNGNNNGKNAEDDLKKNYKNHENENEIVDANEILHYDDIITELNQDDINTMNSILNSANEEDDEIAHGDNYLDKSQIHEYYDDILAKLTEDEENANNPMTNVNQDDIVKNAHDDGILAELTPDELNLISSIIDSADIPSTSGLSSEHMIQHDVGHDTTSTSAHVSQIEPITRSQNTVEPGTFPYSLSEKDLHKPRIHADKTLFKFLRHTEKLPSCP